MKTLSSFAKMAVTAAALSALTLMLSGCFSEDYHAQRDLVSRDAGDSIAANQAINIVNPWPKSAADPDLNTDGKRASLAMQRYQTGKVTPPKGLNTTSGSVSTSNGDQISASVQK